MKNYLAIFFLLIFAGGQGQPFSVETTLTAAGPNFRIHPGSVTQTEVLIARSPLDKNVLFSACNTLNFSPFFVSEGIFSSSDGGLTWQGNDTCNGDPTGFHGGDPGITIDKDGTFVLTRLGRAPLTGLYSHYSSDHGLTWSSQRAISTDDLERAALSTDALLSSPWYGRSYAAWIKFADPYPLMFSYTDDGAGNWSAPTPVNNPAHRSAGGDLSQGPNGELYATWAGVTEASPFKEILVGFAVSYNGGESWNVTEEAFPVSGINGVLSDKANIRVNGLPGIDTDTTHGPRRGWIYIVTGQKDLPPAGNDPDIILNRSSDQGASWTPGIRVNQDPLNNHKIQYFPSVHVDKFGAVNVIFYDDRNTTSDSTGVFLARSVDGGDTWKEYEISDHNFKPVPIGGLGQGYQGDNIDLISTDQRIIPVWMDNSSGIYQIWTVPLDFSIFYGTDDLLAGEGSRLKVFPNPTSGIMNYELEIIKPGRVRLELINIHGKRVFLLSDEKRAKGKYCLKFDPDQIQENLSPGNNIYFLKASGNGFQAVHKVVLIR